jgi:hypothetical protein
MLKGKGKAGQSPSLQSIGCLSRIHIYREIIGKVVAATDLEQIEENKKMHMVEREKKQRGLLTKSYHLWYQIAPGHI